VCLFQGEEGITRFFRLFSEIQQTCGQHWSIVEILQSSWCVQNFYRAINMEACGARYPEKRKQRKKLK